MTAGTRTRLADLPPAQQAGILCGDARFRQFAAAQCDVPATEFSISAAAHFLRDQCGIGSRRELNANSAARERFEALRTEFDVWTGKIAPQNRRPTR